VIARTWHGRVPTGKADAYQSFLERVAVPDYESTPGNRGVLLLRRADGDLTHFVFVTLWDSIEAIRRFAGEDPERARYYPEDDDFLLEKEELVTHAEVVLTR
jgi:heme-degrading monooxygenase HmoA